MRKGARPGIMDRLREAMSVAKEKAAQAAAAGNDLIANAREGNLEGASAAAKVRTATNNDPWGPTGTQMGELAEMSFGHDTRVIMSELRKRLASNGPNWRQCYKALNVVEYLIVNGSERCIGEARDMNYDVRGLERFQHIDREGKDQGVNIRERSKKIIDLLNDNERIYQPGTATSQEQRGAGQPAEVGVALHLT
eukprot:COSAG01_NODE_16714_length_1212_cov_1.084456_1_plen_194_part_01